MTTRIPSRHRTCWALAAFSALLALALLPAAAGATVAAKLRVLTPTEVLDPGTTYYVPDDITVPTTPDADCFGSPGGSGAEFTYDTPNALSLLASAARANRDVRPLALTDQFGFGLGICGIGGAEAVSGESFWYFKANHEEASVGADQLEVKNGDEILFYLAPDDFPNPNPAELELKAPARAQAGQPFSVSVTEHKCMTDSDTFVTTCSSSPAAGVAILGADDDVTTDTDGTAQVEVDEAGTVGLGAVRGTDIPSETLDTCIGDQLKNCVARRGERIVGSPLADKINGTPGSDSIRSRGGDDTIDLRKGGLDTVDCGPGEDTVRVTRLGNDALELPRSCEKVKRK